MKINIDFVLEQIARRVECHKIDTGRYSRWNFQDSDKSRKLGINAYGCADAANILYTLNRFPSDFDERKRWIEALQGFQDKQSGMFYEGSHHIVHTTAHCTAALELFDAKPLYPFYEIESYKDINNFEKMLEGYDWLKKGKAAHEGAGVYAAFVITGAVDYNWIRGYFDIFNKYCDSASGLWIKEPCDEFPVHLRMGDAFHYLFNYSHFYEPFPYPEALIDSCISMYENGQMPETFGKQFHFIEMDWVYCLNRASRQTPHRFSEIREILKKFATDYISYLESVDWDNDMGADDLHLLFGVTCCLAELQQALLGEVVSSVPMRLVLDRRPFI